jgi:hypothetical protein
MKRRRLITALLACGLAGSMLGTASAQAARAPKPKDYTYCVTNGQESECFPAPFEVFRKTHTWKFDEETTGTYTKTGNSFVFTETGGSSDELVGYKIGHGVISGTLRENGKNTEWTFTLTPQ